MCRITHQVEGLLNSIQIVLLKLYVFPHASHPWIRAVPQDSGLFHVPLRKGGEFPCSAVSRFQSEAVSSLLDDFSSSLTLIFQLMV